MHDKDTAIIAKLRDLLHMTLFDFGTFDTNEERLDEFRRVRKVIRATLEQEQEIMIKPSDFTRVNSDTNGNPRYACDFSFFTSDSERSIAGNVSGKYAIACKRANSLGGRKFHNKQYGGGIVFQSYSLDETCNAINRLMQSIKG